MTIPPRIRSRLALAALAILIPLVAGCGLSSGSKESPREVPPPPRPPLPAAVPAPPPPPPRAAGARIADEKKLQNLIQGKTTKAEVQALFGIPQEIVLSPGGESFIYYRDEISGWLFRTTERVETLTIRFEANGILKDFEYRYAGK